MPSPDIDQAARDAHRPGRRCQRGGLCLAVPTRRWRSARWETGGHRAAGTGRRRLVDRCRSHRDPGVARFASLRDQQPGRRSGRLSAARDRAGGLPARGADPVLGHHSLHQHDSRRSPAPVSGQSGNRAADQEHHSLERDGDGGAGQSRRQEHRRPHLHLRLLGHARRGGDEPLHPRPRRRLLRRPGLLPGARLAGHLLPGLPRGPDQ